MIVLLQVAGKAGRIFDVTPVLFHLHVTRKVITNECEMYGDIKNVDFLCGSVSNLALMV